MADFFLSNLKSTLDNCITATAKLEVITGKFSPVIWAIQFAIGLTIESVFLFFALSKISDRIQKTLAN